MPQTIQIRRTTAPNPPATLLHLAEPSFVIAPAKTAMWLGDGSANRCLISTDPADNPIMLASYLPITGGAMTGVLTLSPGTPTNANQAVSKSYVDSMIASMAMFKGTYAVAANTPSLTPPPTLANGDYYTCTTANPQVGETPNASLPIAAPRPQTIYNGDTLIWNNTAFDYIQGGSLTKSQADALYVSLNGSTMTGYLTLSADPTTAMQAATKHYVDAVLATYLPLAGGALTGPLMLHGNATAPLEAVPLQQLQAYTPLSGGTMTGPLVLNANPTNNLGAATKQYVDAAVGAGFSGVVTDASLSGSGMPVAPLSVALVDGGVW